MDDKLKKECLDELYGILRSTDDSIIYHNNKLKMLNETKKRTKYLIKQLNEK